MKSLLKFISLILLVALVAGFVSYNTPLYKKYINSKLKQKIVPDLKTFLDDSYLFEKSNLDRLSYKLNSQINIKLKRNAVYNPRDTRKLFDQFIEKYTTITDTLPVQFYALKTMEIKFYINGAEEDGAAMIYKDNERINNYATLREKIIKADNRREKEKRLEKERKAARKKEKKLAQKAYGFVNFGDTREETLLKFERDPRIKVKEIMVDNPTYKVNFAGHQFNMEPIYKNDNLHLINFVSDGYGKSQYTQNFKELWQEIIDFYTQLHGSTGVKFKSRKELEKGFIEWTAKWEIQKKNIEVGISQNGNTYHVVIWISHDDYPVDKF